MRNMGGTTHGVRRYLGPNDARDNTDEDSRQSCREIGNMAVHSTSEIVQGKGQRRGNFKQSSDATAALNSVCMSPCESDLCSSWWS